MLNTAPWGLYKSDETDLYTHAPGGHPERKVEEVACGDQLSRLPTYTQVGTETDDFAAAPFMALRSISMQFLTR